MSIEPKLFIRLFFCLNLVIPYERSLCKVFGRCSHTNIAFTLKPFFGLMNMCFFMSGEKIGAKKTPSFV